MAVPKTLEAEWLGALGNLPPFEPESGELIVVSPHPDDETLGAGALIAAHCDQGQRVTIVAVTDGENAYGGQHGLGSIRVQEQEEAVRILGKDAQIVRLALTDSNVSSQETTLLNALERIVTPDCHVIAPWIGDFHPDHEACGRAAAEAARKAGARLSWYFFWTWHRGTPDVLDKLSLKSFAFGEELRERKWNALHCHSSQLEHSSGKPILPDVLLAPARRNFEVFAEA